MPSVSATLRTLLFTVAGLCLALPAQAAVITFTTSGPILIPDGTAAPYPVPIVVSGVTETVTDISFTLTDFSHTFPQDVGMILVAPDNTSGIVIFNGGTTSSASGLTLTFQDGGAQWPLSDPLESGTYAPFSYFDGDSFHAPAPSILGVNPTVFGSYAFASAFGGLGSVNGTWNLYIYDFAAGDSGRIGSVSLNFTVAQVPAPPAVFSLVAGLAGLGAWKRLRRA